MFCFHRRFRRLLTHGLVLLGWQNMRPEPLHPDGSEASRPEIRGQRLWMRTRDIVRKYSPVFWTRLTAPSFIFQHSRSGADELRNLFGPSDLPVPPPPIRPPRSRSPPPSRSLKPSLILDRYKPPPGSPSDFPTPSGPPSSARVELLARRISSGHQVVGSADELVSFVFIRALARRQANDLVTREQRWPCITTRRSLRSLPDHRPTLKSLRPIPLVLLQFRLRHHGGLLRHIELQSLRRGLCRFAVEHLHCR